MYQGAQGIDSVFKGSCQNSTSVATKTSLKSRKILLGRPVTHFVTLGEILLNVMHPSLSKS